MKCFQQVGSDSLLSRDSVDILFHPGLGQLMQQVSSVFAHVPELFSFPLLDVDILLLGQFVVGVLMD